MQEQQEQKGSSAQTEQEATNKNHINMITIRSIRSDSKQLVIVAKLVTSWSQNSTIIPYNIDTDSDGNIMPNHIFRILFPRMTEEQLAATAN